MSLTSTSTVPAAIAQLKSYMDSVVAASDLTPLQAYLGVPIAEVSNNYLMVGQWETGQLIQNHTDDWRGFPAIANRKLEEYVINGTLRVWNGNSDPPTRLTELYGLIDAMLAQFANDPKGGGNLSPSGSWQMTNIEIVSSGPFGGKGWGALVSFEVPVINAILNS